MDQLTAGAIAMGFGVAGLFFLRFWRETGDRLFALFALAFLTLAANRVGLSLSGRGDREEHYWVRFLAFALILAAVWDKNRSRKPSAP
jgi:hypothetical protein